MSGLLSTNKLPTMSISVAKILFFNVLIITCMCKQSQQLCSAPRKITKEGDLTIVALFPIHLYNSTTSRYELNLQAAVWVEALIFAIEEINSNRTILGNKTLGYTIYDTCNIVSIAQRSVLETILDTGIPNGSTGYNASDLRCTCIANYTSNVVSVIGGASSKISTQVSTLLGVDLIPQISYSSTSIDLSNKHKYPSFIRTIPPDNFQAEFIIDILENYKWTYINVFASDDSYGRIGVEYLIPLLGNKGICVAILEVFSTRLNPEELDNTVKDLMEAKAANVTVLWSGKTAARAIINAAARVKLHGQTWIATEGWGGDEEMLKMDSRVIKGMIGGIPLMKLYEPFEKHLVGKSTRGLRAYKEFYNATNCQNISNSQEPCPNLHIFKTSSYILRVKISNVIDAVYVVANGLQRLSNQNISYHELLNVIKELKFVGSTGMTVQFNENGNPSMASYSLVNTGLNQDGSLGFQLLGQWDSESRKISFLKDVKIQFAGEGTAVPLSRCADECGPGFYAFMETNKKCCWKCLRCRRDTFKDKPGNEQCTPCIQTSVSNKNNTGCIELKELYLNMNSIYGIIVVIMSVLGATLSLAGGIVFLLFRDTPLVRSSNRELSILQLTISTFAFIYPLLYVIKPNVIICYARPLVFGVLFSISNSIIFTKADRLLRIFKIRYRVRRSVTLFISNKFQLMVVVAMAGLAVLLCLMSFIYHPPKLGKTIDRDNISIDIQCVNTAFATNLLVAYMGVISITCIVYTIKSKDLPRQFREGRYIGLGMFVASLVWLFYLPIALSGQLKDVDFAFCLAVCISNATLLYVIYWSKAWRILLHPEENNPETFRGQIGVKKTSASQSSRSSLTTSKR